MKEFMMQIGTFKVEVVKNGYLVSNSVMEVFVAKDKKDLLETVIKEIEKLRENG